MVLFPFNLFCIECFHQKDTIMVYLIILVTVHSRHMPSDQGISMELHIPFHNHFHHYFHLGVHHPTIHSTYQHQIWINSWDSVVPSLLRPNWQQPSWPQGNLARFECIVIRNLQLDFDSPFLIKMYFLNSVLVQALEAEIAWLTALRRNRKRKNWSWNLYPSQSQAVSPRDLQLQVPENDLMLKMESIKNQNNDVTEQRDPLLVLTVQLVLRWGNFSGT